MTNDRKGILVAAPERWDEACFSVPAVRALIASGVGVGILCVNGQREFWESIEDLEVISISEGAKLKDMAAGLRGGWQASLAWGDGDAAKVFKLAGIPRRLGPRENKKWGKLHTHELAMVVKPLDHRVKFYLSAVEELGVAAGEPRFFSPWDLGVPVEFGSVLLCPGSDFGRNHEWPLGGWVEIGGRLLAEGARVKVVSFDGSESLGRELSDRLGDQVELVDVSLLGGALRLLAAHSFVISADGSLPHLAAHAGVTALVLFGPNDPAWKRPLGRRHSTVRRHVECAPCLLSKCPLDLRCQNELTIDRVWEAVQALMIKELNRADSLTGG